MDNSFNIPVGLFSEISASGPYTQIFKVELKEGETLELKFISQNKYGVFIYSSRLGNIGISNIKSVIQPGLGVYERFIGELGKDDIIITPIVIMTGVDITSYSNSAFYKAILDRCMIQIKPGPKGVFDAILDKEARRSEELRVRWAKEDAEKEKIAAAKREEERIKLVKIREERWKQVKAKQDEEDAEVARKKEMWDATIEEIKIAIPIVIVITIVVVTFVFTFID